jgi:contact-dependent growth inhibition (CDI) system CdiA-like toxin
LARDGYDVEQNPPPTPNGKEPDCRIEGEYFDCYAPETGNLDNVRDAISDKVAEGQADRIVLNLDDSLRLTDEIADILRRKPIGGLRELIVIRDGKVTPLIPPSSSQASFVALEYTFLGSADVSTQDMLAFMADAIGGVVTDGGFVQGNGLQVAAYRVAPGEEASASRLLGFTHRVTATFRFANLAAPELSNSNEELMMTSVVQFFETYPGA